MWPVDKKIFQHRRTFHSNLTAGLISSNFNKFRGPQIQFLHQLTIPGTYNLEFDCWLWFAGQTSGTKMACLQPRGLENVKDWDTTSEVSDSGTTTSERSSCWDSKEDLKEFAAQIGLDDVSGLYQERFRVDRKKIEKMLSGITFNKSFIIYSIKFFQLRLIFFNFD